MGAGTKMRLPIGLILSNQLIAEWANLQHLLSIRHAVVLRNQVHDIRICIKKIRSYLWITRCMQKLGRDPLPDTLKDVASGLSVYRDQCALEESLLKLTCPALSADKTFKSSLEYVIHEQNNLMNGTRHYIELAGKKLAGSSFKKSYQVLLKVQFDQACARIDKSIKSISKQHDEEAFPKEVELQHGMRKKSKRIYYVLQSLVAYLGMKNEWVDSIRKLNGTLGDLRDLHLLESYLQKINLTSPELMIRIQRKQKHLFDLSKWRFNLIYTRQHDTGLNRLILADASHG